jgi:hypothetical protein
MLRLKELRDVAARELEVLEMQVREARVKVATLDMAIAALEGTTLVVAARPKPTSSGVNVKQAVLDIVVDAGAAGVSAAEVVRRARDNGRSLNPTSVSSLLSRLKREGTLDLSDGKYVPAKLGSHMTLDLQSGIREIPFKGI